jgi:hypothetical protein
MKRRRQQEHDEEIAREQADARREALLAELRTRQAAGQEPEPVPEPPPAEEVPDEPDVADEEPGAAGPGR